MEDNYLAYPIDTGLAEAAKMTPELQVLLDTAQLSLPDFIRRQLYSRSSVDITLMKEDKLVLRRWCQGSLLMDNSGQRLMPGDVMFVGLSPSTADMEFTESDLTQVLDYTCEEERDLMLPQITAPHWCWVRDVILPVLPDCGTWYFTHLVKYADRDRDGKKPKMTEFKLCRPFFEQELRAVQPKYLLIFGKYAARHLLKSAKITEERAMCMLYRGEYEFEDGEKLSFEAVVFPSLTDMQSAKNYDYNARILARQCRFFRSHFYGDDLDGLETDKGKRYVMVETRKELAAEVDRIMELAVEDPQRRILAVDLEWEGAYPDQPGAEVLTVQFSSAPGEATVAILNSHRLRELEDAAQYRARVKGLIEELTRLLTWHDTWKPRVGGHFLRADLPWLDKLGIRGEHDVMWSYQAAARFENCKVAGGWDTSVMYHAYNEKDSYGLKYLASKEFGVPSWDAELAAYQEAYEKEQKLKVNGYAFVPDAILHPYAAKDADYTRTLAQLLMFGYDGRKALLDDDGYGNESWLPFWLAHRAAPGFLEIESTGLMLDKERYANLSQHFYEAAEILLSDLRQKIGWPEFNPASSDHKRLLLFGPRYCPDIAHLFPEGAHCLNMAPVYDSKYKRIWDELDVDGDETFRPSTDKNVMTLLAAQSPIAAQLRDVCKLQTMLKGVLSTPVERWDHLGYHKLFPKGHFQHLREDGRIHSHLSQLLATGRAASSRPNLQNIGKSAEADLKRILGSVDKEGNAQGDYLDLLGGPQYLYPVRTMYRAPKDHLFIEADFTGAELAVMAWVSQDPQMMEHVRRNALPESHPDFYDIHSNVAVRAFQLDCEPTKSGLASIGKKHIRNAAKAVVFGIPYGRGAAAIALQCQIQGIDLSVAEARGIIEAYFTLYPRTREYLNRCRDAVTGCGFVQTLFRRFRRFRCTSFTTEETVAKMGREFCNAPIQGSVADAVNVAIFNLLRERYRSGLRFKIAMQIHDALLLEVHKDCAAEVYQRVLPDAMVTHNPIVVAGKEYRFAIESDLSVHWGEELTDPLAQEYLGMSLKDIKGE